MRSEEGLLVRFEPLLTPHVSLLTNEEDLCRT